MCALTFPVKIPVIRQHDTPRRLSLQEEDPGAMIHMFHLATPCTLLGLHVSATHFLQMQRDVCVCVCEVRMCVYTYQYLIWIHTIEI